MLQLLLENRCLDSGFAAHAHEIGDHDSFVEELVHELYQDHDAVVLLMSKSTGSKYEDVIDDIISLIEDAEE